MKLYNKLHSETSTQTQGITASQFLNKDSNFKGYSEPTTFVTYAKSLRPPEIEQLDQFFNFVKSGVRIVGSITTRLDRANRNYQHPAFLNLNSQQGCKVIIEAGMKEFLQDYMLGKVSINFTLEELIEEALN